MQIVKESLLLPHKMIGVTIAANLDYCDSIAIGENTIAIVLLLVVYYCNSIGYIGNQIKFSLFTVHNTITYMRHQLTLLYDVSVTDA